MKNAVLFLLVSLTFACSTPEKRAKDLIKEDLSKTLDDYDSYQSVEYGPITPLTELELIKESSDYLLKSGDALFSGNSYYSSKSLSNKYDLLKQKIDNKKVQLETTFPEAKNDITNGRFLEYKMDHKFRAKNRIGTYLLAHYIYYFDSSVTKIVGIEDLTE
jgi:hypothetical protein